MSLHLWTLTPVGKAMAVSTRNPRSPAWTIIHYLRRVGSATTDQIVTYTGLSSAEVSATLLKLKITRPPIVSEGIGVEV